MSEDEYIDFLEKLIYFLRGYDISDDDMPVVMKSIITSDYDNLEDRLMNILFNIEDELVMFLKSCERDQKINKILK